MTKIKRAAKIREIAKIAGVSTATVDRVLNQRKNVGDATRQRVLQAKSAIETGENEIVRRHPWRIKVLLPEDAGPSTEYLASCFQDIGAIGKATIECIFTKKMEPGILARKLRACANQGIDAVAFQALDDPRVRDAVSELASYNIPALTLLSGLGNAPVIGFVGVDNRAAGRTAAFLTGRMTRPPGKIAIITGGQLYHSHEDREIGFRTVLRREFPQLEVISTHSGNDDIEGNYQETKRVLEQAPDLLAVYNVGGGNEGIVRALQESDIGEDIMLVSHNLTPKTHSYLLDGSMDIVIHQNMRAAALNTVETLIAHLNGKPQQPSIIPVEIITRENLQSSAYGK
ncbi:MAG: LacI family transcriptional regulator [Blastopirellula sp.]|nr:MAG: LacI family transcriptional regulator [Blastopirellula sp.]